MEHTFINGYGLKYKLGDGGMAEVWYAENRLQKPAAVKILKRELAGMQDAVSRFETEAHVMVQLQHPHIRNIFDYTMVDGRPCMIMEYLEGMDLSQRMKNGERFTNEQVITWWNQLTNALQYTHDKNIIHRDIKPSNLFLTNSNEIKILDFGIAKLRDNVTVTQTGSRMGTLMYMSPEQVYDVKNITYKTDIYSFAVTFYHIISGVPPYDADTLSNFEIQESIVRQQIDTTHLPSPWNYVLPLYLKKKPEDRNDLMPVTDFEITQDINETMYYTPRVPEAQNVTQPVNANSKPVNTTAPVQSSSNRLGSWFIILFITAGLVGFALKKNEILSFLGFNNPVTVKENIKNNKRPVKKEIKKLPTEKQAVRYKDTTIFSEDTAALTKIENENYSEQEALIKRKINDYYLTRKNCGELSQFFKDTVAQYYSKSNVPLSQIQQECEAYHGKWRFTQAEIADHSYVMNFNRNGNIYVDYSMLYKIKQQEEDDWIPYNIDVSVVFSPDMKMIRIVERRIEKL